MMVYFIRDYNKHLPLHQLIFRLFSKNTHQRLENFFFDPLAINIKIDFIR